MPKFVVYFETMAGTHLADSVRALRDAGSADALYDLSLRATDAGRLSYEDLSIARDEAEGRRVGYSRHALLFAAFAAEAYANDYLYEKWGGQDRDGLRWLSAVNKYALLPALAGRRNVFDRGRQPLQRIKWLFQRRDELVHVAPHDDRDLTYDPTNHNPRAAAEAIVAVADAVGKLTGDVPDGSVLSYVVDERRKLLRYGTRAARDMPDPHDPPSPTDLLSDARRRHWRRG
jgi:hypothetical protein